MQSVDVLFINPGNRKEIYQDLADEFCGIEPPAFAGLYATYLMRKGISVAILDAPGLGLNTRQVSELALELYSPRLVVLAVYGYQPSASTQNMTAAGEIASFVKAGSPSMPILMTGTHIAALPERTMREEEIDFACDAEGPVTIYRTLMALKSGGSFGDIPSLWWRDGKRIVPPSAPEILIKDLDAEMPGIAWELMDMSLYRAHNWHCFDHIDQRAPYASIHTTLGCPYKCSFCCINAPFGPATYRRWEPETVIAEIDKLVYQYGVRNIKFVDEMFVLNKRHVNGICDLLAERDYEVNIWAYARVDTVKDEFLERLKRAGINWICLGIESASEYVRDGAEKRYGNDDIIDTVRRIQNAGLHVLGNFIFGLPDDTNESMKQTLDMAKELNCEFANFYCAMAYPGSKLYRDAVAAGLRLPEKWHHFSQHGYDSLPLSSEALESWQILQFRDRAFDDYFSSEGYLRMVERKFGGKVVEHIKRMTKIKLRRRIVEEATGALSS